MNNLLNTVLIAGQPKRHLLSTGWYKCKETRCWSLRPFLSGMFTLPVFKTVNFLSCSVSFPSDRFCLVDFLCLIASSGMKKISFCWEFAGQIDHKLSCHLQSYEVIACISVLLLQLLMLLRQIAGLQFSTTQGRTSIIIYFSGAFPVKCFNICFCRANPSEFVISLAKYVEALYHTRIYVGMHFRMLFLRQQTEESSI